MKTKDLQFKSLTENDFTQIHQWFQEPIINHWYSRNKSWSLDDIKNKYTDRIVGKENIPSFIIWLDDQPIGFIQYYLLRENLAEGISDYTNELFKQFSPQDIAGIDLFIAHTENRGKGYGVKIIHHFLNQFLNDHFKAVIVDPEMTNIQAIKCYEKAGFVKSNFSEDEKHLILIKHNPPSY